jgi:hypothetical protein
MQLHLYLMGLVNSDEYWGDQIPRLENYGTFGMLSVRSIKLVTDGTQAQHHILLWDAELGQVPWDRGEPPS